MATSTLILQNNFATASTHALTVLSLTVALALSVFFISWGVGRILRSLENSVSRDTGI